MMLFYVLEDMDDSTLTAVVDINTLKGWRLDTDHPFTTSRFRLKDRLMYKSASHFPKEFFE